jgi:hypothetical protein
MLEPSMTMKELKKKVVYFFKRQPARGTLIQRSDTTVKNYTNVIFSEWPTSLQGYLKEYLPGKSLLDLVFR